MPARPRPSKRRLKSTMDSVLLHDMRNMGFRLGLVLENLEEHFGDPDFKRSVVELLQGTREKLDTMVSRWTAHTDSILIKVEVDLNDIVHEVLRVAHVRGPADGGPPRVTAELAPLPRVWEIRTTFRTLSSRSSRTPSRPSRRPEGTSSSARSRSAGPGDTPSSSRSRTTAPG